MSKFGFDKKARILPAIMKAAMTRLANETRDYFVMGFVAESWGSQPWKGVKRVVPPPILNVTGRLKQKTQDSIKSVTRNKVVMENTATDDRGRHYSDYHNEGTDRMAARSIMKQAPELTKIQIKVLEEETGKIWQVV